MAGKVDVRELKDFSERLNRFTGAQRDEFFTECTNELAARFLRKAVKRTPVGVRPKRPTGKRTAKAKGNSGKSKSFLTAEQARYEQYWGSYTGGTLRRSWQASSVSKTGNIYSAEIYNNTRYARYVEFGHRQTPGRYVPAINKRLKRGWVDGRFMASDSEKEINTIAPRFIEQRLNRRLKEVFE